jgi:Tfp pilus assembly protein PilX
MSSPRNQAGATLVVALLMLAVLALLGVNAVNNSTVNLRIIFNMQAHQNIEAAAQDAIEQVIGTIASFNNPQDQNVPSTTFSWP